jgi:hypothetical protein
MRNFGVALFVATAIACVSGENGSGAQGMDELQNPPATNVPNNPGGSTGGNPAAVAPALIGESCKSSDPNHICLALKYIVYTDSSGRPSVTSTQAAANIKVINKIWNQCNIGFQIETYHQIEPSKHHLVFSTANIGDLDEIRSTFEDPDHLLVVTTGSWNRTGSLGHTSANAWTSLPGSTPYGAVLEASVGNFGNILAHELGHYLNLDHLSEATDLMNPIIYDNSTQLNQDQCNSARSTANSYWADMER